MSFGLTRDATQSEIKDAYRTLAKVWHPDRFQSDEHLRVKAEAKLKEINSNYELLTTTVDAGAHSRSSRPASRPQESQRETAAAPGRAAHQQSSTSPFKPPVTAKPHANKKWLAIVVAILITAGFWVYLRHGQMVNPGADDRRSQTTLKSAVPAGAAGQNSQQKKQSQNQPSNYSGKPAETLGAHTRTNATASLVVYPDEDARVPFFTVGSTKNDVIRVQGTPVSVAGNVFRYGASEVYFQNGRVQSWRIDPSSPLNAQMPEQ